MKQVNGIMGVSGYVMDGFPGVGKPAPLSRAKRARRGSAPISGDVSARMADAIREWAQVYGHASLSIKMRKDAQLIITPNFEQMNEHMRIASQRGGDMSKAFSNWPHMKIDIENKLSDHHPVSTATKRGNEYRADYTIKEGRAVPNRPNDQGYRPPVIQEPIKFGDGKISAMAGEPVPGAVVTYHPPRKSAEFKKADKREND